MGGRTSPCVVGLDSGVAVPVVCDRVDLDALKYAADILEAANVGFFATDLTAEELLAVSRAFVRCQKLAAAGTMLAADAIDRVAAHRRDGHRSAADHLANEAGTSAGAAQSTINTAKKLRERQATTDALRRGRLSTAQAGVIADADKDDEQELLDLALSGRRGFRGLKDEAARLAAARQSEEDAMAAYRRVHAGRHLRTWMSGGAFCFAGTATPDDGARMLASLEAETQRLFKLAHKEARHESNDAYRLDALINVLSGTANVSRRPVTAMRLSVDAATIERGHLGPGERCEIEGFGPIPVSIARSLLVDSDVHVVAFSGVDVHDVTSTSRYIPAATRRALLARDPCCSIPGCGQTKGLEIDHISEYAKHGPTELDNLVRLCRAHHQLKTTLAWRITGPPAARQWLPPAEATRRE